ncbi:Predicted ATPase [Aquiflexum balticum DSM 16537]|uniref:Predicted ATPase n=1 Tax=Aquiflexum balticum DSM 16537 TaxID=758820 RepID=A0A1W2H961_9BACT|nr:AAA family ATPase [Aquiflexum balticum]SMD45228.1 Predicted ATPase [Aquiflexum balticum DSM 16537]
MPIDRIRIQNFKSIRDSGDIKIAPINILIGANGVGKSNFISFFKMLNSISKKRLEFFVADNGYENSLLYFGRKKSKSIEGSIIFKPLDKNTNNRYDFKLVPKSQSSGFYFERDEGGFNSFARGYNESWSFEDLGGKGKTESGIFENGLTRAEFLRAHFSSFNVFHFHDTSSSSSLRQPSKTLDYRYLKSDGSNLAAFLYRIKSTHPKHFKMIEYTIGSVAPFFERFDLEPDAKNPEVIFLNWFEKGSDEYFNAFHLSDGTLRFIALTTLLLQPDLPSTIILDEPELGLHPIAISKLAGMVKKASVNSQIIIATQSVNLVNEFSADDILVANREDNQTVFKRQSAQALENWLEEYSVGELWEKNVIGGRI